jgi:hypothetical protein
VITSLARRDFSETVSGCRGAIGLRAGVALRPARLAEHALDTNSLGLDMFSARLDMNPAAAAAGRPDGPQRGRPAARTP